MGLCASSPAASDGSLVKSDLHPSLENENNGTSQIHQGQPSTLGGTDVSNQQQLTEHLAKKDGNNSHGVDQHESTHVQPAHAVHAHVQQAPNVEDVHDESSAAPSVVHVNGVALPRRPHSDQSSMRSRNANAAQPAAVTFAQTFAPSTFPASPFVLMSQQQGTQGTSTVQPQIAPNPFLLGSNVRGYKPGPSSAPLGIAGARPTRASSAALPSGVANHSGAALLSSSSISSSQLAAIMKGSCSAGPDAISIYSGRSSISGVEPADVVLLPLDADGRPVEHPASPVAVSLGMSYPGSPMHQQHQRRQGGVVLPSDGDGGSQELLLQRPGSLLLQQVHREVQSLRLLGQGAGGVVYMGIWQGVAVAVKFALCSSPDQLMEKAREAVLSRYLSHPNVVQTFTYDVTLLTERVLAEAEAEAEAHDPANEQLSRPGATRDSDGSDPTAAIFSGSMQVAGGSGTGAGNSGALHPGAGNSDALHPGGVRSGGNSTFDGPLALLGGSCTMHDVLTQLGAQPGQHLTHIIMELCDVGTLTKAIRTGCFSGHPEQRTKLRALLRTAREVARGVAFLHSLDLVHLDLKPGNVLLKSSSRDSRGFTAKVADFGLARRLKPHRPQQQQQQQQQLQPNGSSAPQQAAAGVGGGVDVVAEGGEEVVGTLAYLAPDVMHGTVCKAADVYSLGVIIWQMCTGQVPFQGMHAAQLLYAKQQGTAVLTWPPGVCAPLRRLADLCLSATPGSRPTANQVATALQKIEQHLQQKAGGSGRGGALAASAAVSAAAAAAEHLQQQLLQGQARVHAAAAGAAAEADMLPIGLTPPASPPPLQLQQHNGQQLKQQQQLEPLPAAMSPAQPQPPPPQQQQCEGPKQQMTVAELMRFYNNSSSSDSD